MNFKALAIYAQVESIFMTLNGILYIMELGNHCVKMIGSFDIFVFSICYAFGFAVIK